MAILNEISTIISRLNSELSQIEQEATEGISLLRNLLSRFPDNLILIQFFAYLNNVLLFIEVCKNQTQDVIDLFIATEPTARELQEVGEDLGNTLGKVVENKVEVTRIVTRLRSLQ